MDFEQAWAVKDFRLIDLPPSTWKALAEPPLQGLPVREARVRRERIEAIPFRHIHSMLALLGALREPDLLASLRILGLVEDVSEEAAATRPARRAPRRSSRSATANPPKAAQQHPAGCACGGSSPQPPAVGVEPSQVREVQPTPPRPPEALPWLRPLLVPALPAAAAPLALLPPVRTGLKLCRECGAPFKAVGRQVYCAVDCLVAARRRRQLKADATQDPRQPKPCAHCRELFTPLRRNGLWCSITCQRQYINAQRRRERAESLAVKECEHCRVSFRPAQRNSQRFCTPQCARNAAARRGGWVTLAEQPPRICAVCGASFRARKGCQQTCGTNCGRVWSRLGLRKLVEEFGARTRYRWLLRQVDQLGLQEVARHAQITPEDVSAVLGALRSLQEVRNAIGGNGTVVEQCQPAEAPQLSPRPALPG